MQTIVLTELVPYSFTQLYVYLAKLNAQEYCIQLPRQEMDDQPVFLHLPVKSAVNDEAHHYVMEYYDAMYIGERLSALSNDLSYTVPLPKSPEHFTYEFSTSDLDLLADTLYLLGGAFPRDPYDRLEQYIEARDRFWDSYCADEVSPYCCGLLHIMEQKLAEN